MHNDKRVKLAEDFSIDFIDAEYNIDEFVDLEKYIDQILQLNWKYYRVFRSNDIVNLVEMNLNDLYNDVESNDVLYDESNYQNMPIVDNIEISSLKTV